MSNNTNNNANYNYNKVFLGVSLSKASRILDHYHNNVKKLKGKDTLSKISYLNTILPEGIYADISYDGEDDMNLHINLIPNDINQNEMTIREFTSIYTGVKDDYHKVLKELGRPDYDNEPTIYSEYIVDHINARPNQ